MNSALSKLMGRFHPCRFRRRARRVRADDVIPQCGCHTPIDVRIVVMNQVVTLERLEHAPFEIEIVDGVMNKAIPHIPQPEKCHDTRDGRSVEKVGESQKHSRDQNRSEPPRNANGCRR